MTIKDLHNGAVVQLRNGQNYIKVDNLIYGLTNLGEFRYIEGYDENNNFDPFPNCKEKYTELDVTKMNDSYKYGHSNAMEEVYCFDKWTWERNKEILTKEEHDYLASIIAPFRDRVGLIAKIGEKGKNEAYIFISTIDNGFACLPFFNKKEKYLNMEENKSYTLKELDL